MIKLVFHKEKLNMIGTVYEKHILSFTTTFKTSFLWEIDLMEFERTGRIS